MSINGIFGFSGTGLSCVIDPEYQRIIRELRALGIEPSGDKATDKAKLERVQSSKDASAAQTEGSVQANKTFGETIEELAGIEMSEKEELAGIEMSEKVNAAAMTGATQISELNKLRFLGAV